MARRTALNPAERDRRVRLGERRRAQSRRTLLAAAHVLFARHGAEAPTIDDVIAEAGVARGTFYNHFKTRDELFRAVADDLAAAINERLDVALAGMVDPAERLALGFRVFARYAAAEPARGWILLRTMPLLGGVNPRVTEQVRREFAAGVDGGRFPALPMPVAFDLGMGLQLRIIYRLLAERAGTEAVDQAARALLIALGLDPAEADEIASRPLEPGLLR